MLVSVRNAHEAVEALAGGADIIDIKEPLAGPLGAADWTTIAAVLDVVAGRAPVSAALGELSQWPALAPTAFATRLSYVKFGLAGGAGFDWPAKFSAAFMCFPVNVVVIPVAYADHEAALAPAPSEVLRQAGRLGCRLALVDTFDKQSPGLVSCWSETRLRQASIEARAAGMQLALAGSVRIADIERLAACEPAVIGVRGAACAGGRLGTVQRGLVRRLREALEHALH